jgi:hypothetical protein
MNIGIYELEHFESVYPLIRFHEKENNRIILFVSERVFHELNARLKNSLTCIEWFIKPDKKAIRSFLWDMFLLCKEKKIQTLYLHTVSSNHLFFAFLVGLLRNKCQIIITVHEVNNFFLSKFSFNLRILIRHVGKKILFLLCRQYMTISESTCQYLRQITQNKLPVHWFPGGIFEEEYYEAPTLPYNTINIVVPGTLDSRRRDYKDVFVFLKKANARQLSVHVCLLGGNVEGISSDIINDCNEYLRSFMNLTFYHDAFISSSDFQRKMNEAHFIWVPSVIRSTIEDDIEEIYGVSKTTGNLFDAIRFARPLILPEVLKIDAYHHSAVYKYRKIDDIIDFLFDVSSAPVKYKLWEENALNVSRIFNTENIKYFNK